MCYQRNVSCGAKCNHYFFFVVGMIPAEVPQILINREPLPQVQFDIELYGNSDVIIAQLCGMMGPDFKELANSEPFEEIAKLMKEGPEEQGKEVSEPKSEHDVEALKACWEPKTTHNLADKLPCKFNSASDLMCLCTLLNFKVSPIFFNET